MRSGFSRMLPRRLAWNTGRLRPRARPQTIIGPTHSWPIRPAGRLKRRRPGAGSAGPPIAAGLSSQDQLAGFEAPPDRQSDEEHSRSLVLAVLVAAVPLRLVASGSPHSRSQGGHAATTEI